MRKIIVSEMVSIDGYFADQGSGTSWHNVDAEFNEEYAVPMLNSADLLLFGRVTHDMMASYWPTEQGMADDPIVAEKMNSVAKLVFSKSTQTSDWANTTFASEINPDEILKLKQQPGEVTGGGKDILVFGSGTIVQALTDLGLVDEYRIIVNPVILGSGKNLFAGVSQRKLKLLRVQEFNSGNVLLCYSN